MTSVKKVKVALLALVAALVIAIPTSAFADTIAINSETTGDVYQAYQIFSGEYATDTTNKAVLSKVRWGNGIPADKQADALAAIQELEGFESATDAASVAEALANIENNSAAADAFAAAIAPFLTANPYAFGTTNPYTSVALPDGYYLVKQSTAGTAANDQTGAKTKFVAQLVGPETEITIDAKASVPEVFKGVIEDEDNDGTASFLKALENYRKDAHYDTNEDIPYYIAGTLPTTYDDYSTYYYEFTDTMSKGLTYQDDAAVYLAYNGVIPENAEALEDWDIDFTTDSEGITVLTVKTDNLKKYVEAYDSTVKVVVLYTARLNKDCVVGNSGNPNDVDLTYSNNPNSGGEGEKGKTPKKYAVVFTFALDDTKVDDVDNTVLLANAEFIIGKSATGPWAVIENGCVKQWVADESKASTMKSDSNGKFGVKGLDADSYVIKETVAPAGYNLKTDLISFTISADLPDQATINGGTINATVSGEGSAINNGTVSQTVTNKQGGTLPSTGGIGTTIFTIVGIALIVAAAAIMVVRRRNAAAIQ